jgi:hypothetical protein
MYGSLLFALSTFQLVTTNSVEPQLGAKDAKPAPLRQIVPEMTDLSGYYTCKGQEAGGKNYSGIVVLTKKNDVYLISWVIGGGSTFSGIAIRQGSTLAGSWSIPSDRGIIRGVNLYRVEAGSSGPRLSGHWASVPGAGVQQPETLTFLKKLENDDDD